jgi:sialic acid synthase SpsE
MKNNFLKIRNKILKNFGRPFITAEVGVNHNGNLKTALKMIDLAKKSGCDAVKFQTFKADEIVQDKKLKFKYISKNKIIHESMNAMFKRYELKEKDWKTIYNYCLKKKIIFFSTPQNLTDLKILKKFNIPIIKVGSDDFVNLELIKNYSKLNLPLILSTGMSTIKNFKDVLKIKTLSKKKIIFLLCTSEYPTMHNNVNIKKIYSIKKIVGHHLIGFSDHTKDNIASIMAVAHGCCFFEKHFTLNNNLPGPDHSFSCNPMQLKSWVKSIRGAYKCMGSEIIQPTEKEKKNKENYQRKIIAKNFIKKGQKINYNDIILLRTSNKKALPSSKLNKIIGRRSVINIKSGDPVYL